MNEDNTQEYSILSNCTSGGCGAKIGAGDLQGILKNIPQTKNEHLLVGFDSKDDAAVYQLNQNGIISTIDFFPPMVEDPYRFGRIAATNALSDVYAMGGTVLFALNMICFPRNVSFDILEKILLGGAEKVQEAGAVIVGGHSIYDHEMKYGLAVTGSIEPDLLIRNDTIKTGDLLILTKGLGVGLIQSAVRGGVVDSKHEEISIASMERLNKDAAVAMKKYQVNACTDVTGFGLLGHAIEMAGNNHSLVIDTESLPILSGAFHYAEEFLATAAGQRNRHFLKNINIDHINPAMQEILFDPQTSGGLLISVAVNDAVDLLAEINKTDPIATIIGEVVPRATEPLIIL